MTIGSVNKSELLDELALMYPELKKEYLIEFVELFLERVESSILSGNKVNLKGFGHFTVWKKRPRLVYRPAEGVTEMLYDRSSVRFKPSKLLKDKVNTEELILAIERFEAEKAAEAERLAQEAELAKQAEQAMQAEQADGA